MNDEPSPFAAFGVFAPIFDDGHYLPLLNIYQSDDAVSSLLAVVSAHPPSLEADALALLNPAAGWRPQLVGAAAMLAGAATPKTIEALWAALAQPSWVSPQLAVAAFLLDPAFEDRAKHRILDGCRVGPKSLREKYPDREWNVSQDAKQLTALIALCKRVPNAAWLTDVEASAETRAIITEARDDGGGIALGWLDKASQLLMSGS